MAEIRKKRFSLIDAFAPGLKRFRDFLNGVESGVVDPKAVEECESYIKAMSDGQYDKDDIIIGNEYIRELQNVRDRANSNSGGRKKQVKQIESNEQEQDNERA
ncbi:MAG: hypothetical protein J6J36_00090 [Clostridia bacterium]|nr:hypothetical protein [Clostridia bacterium]